MSKMSKASRLVSELVRKLLKPPLRLGVEKWADNFRVLSSEGSAKPGRWKTSRTPYMREIYRAVTRKEVRTVVVMAAAQMSKSELLMNIIGRYIHIDPSPMIMMQPTDMAAKNFSKERIAPMIRDTPVLAGLVKDPAIKNSGNTVSHKMFPGGFLAFVGSYKETNLASRPARVVLCDEVDRYARSAGNEGSPLELIKKRTQTFADSKTVITGTPSIKGASEIEDEYNNTSQAKYYLKCEQCGSYEELLFEKIVWETEVHDSSKVVNVAMTCGSCGVASSEKSWKRNNQEHGKWIHEFPGRTSAIGFKINGLAGVFRTWESIVEEWLAAENDIQKKKAFVNTVLAETFEEEFKEKLDHEVLMARAEEYEAEVPEGVLILTCGVDTQDNWFAIEVLGHGVNGETWGIEYKIIKGNFEQDEVWEELDRYLLRNFRNAQGTDLYIYSTCIDTGGHYTDNVYEFVKKRQNTRRIFGIKGQRGDVPVINGFRRTKNDKIDLLSIGVNALKDINYGRLKINNPGKGYCHFPLGIFRGYDEEYFKSLTSEVKIMKDGKVTWKAIRKRNEGLDTRNYALAALMVFDNLNMEEVAKLSQQQLTELSLNGQLAPTKRIKKRNTGGIESL